jgi:hypothetical protein
MAKVFFAKIRKVSSNALGITVPQEVVNDNDLKEETNYWFKLMGKLRKPGDDEE